MDSQSTDSQSMDFEMSEFFVSMESEYDDYNKLFSELISVHVSIWYNQRGCNALFNKLEEQKAKGQGTKNLSFEFCAYGWNGSPCVGENVIKECGVWPIYASEYGISINDLELREGIKLGYRTDDIDEQVDPQFNELGSSTNATAFTSSVFVHRDQDISILNTRQDLPEVNFVGLLNRDRFKELDYPTTQMELNLELGFGNKSRRCRDMDDHRPFQRKKFSRCQDIGELLGGASTSGIGVGCSEFARQPLTQTNTMNEFLFRPPPTNISMQNAWLDSSQMNSIGLHDRFNEFDSCITQLSPTGFCPDLNEMPTGGNSLDTDQQSPGLSLQLNQGHPQMNPIDIGNNSGLYTSSSSAGLLDIGQMTQMFCTNNRLNLNSIRGLDGSITQFSQTEFCPNLNEMPIGGNSLDTEQQSHKLSLQLNQGDPQ